MGLGNLLSFQNNVEEAQNLFRRALKAAQKHLGKDHPICAGILNSQATLYANSGNVSEFETVIEESLSIRKHLFSMEHYSVQECLLNKSLMQLMTTIFKYQELAANDIKSDSPTHQLLDASAHEGNPETELVKAEKFARDGNGVPIFDNSDFVSVKASLESCLNSFIAQLLHFPNDLFTLDGQLMLRKDTAFP